MMNVGEITKRIEERLPPIWSEGWDNVGLLIGDAGADVDRIAVSLDATEDVVEEAAEKGCRMLIVHHPAIFRPLKRIVSPSPVAAMISAAIKEGIAVYSSHTNWDSSPEGVNAVLARLIGLSGVEPIIPSSAGAWGMGAIGSLPSPLSVTSLARKAKEAWNLSTLLAYGDGEAPLARVALCGGAGGDLLESAMEMGADVFITADLSYHYLLHAQLTDTHLVVANHGEMERASLPDLCRVVREASGLDVILLESGNWTPIVI